MTYWYGGAPAAQIQVVANQSGTMLYWSQGQPADYILFGTNPVTLAEICRPFLEMMI